jgi:hypothetical protein
MAIPKLNEKHVAMTVGCFGAVMHAIWVGIVFAGMAQGSLNMLFGLHFISLATAITAFNYYEALKLIVLGFVGGAIFGWLFAALWNWTATKSWAK